VKNNAVGFNGGRKELLCVNQSCCVDTGLSWLIHSMAKSFVIYKTLDAINIVKPLHYIGTGPQAGDPKLCSR